MIQWKNHISAFTGAHQHLDNSFLLVQQITVFVGIPSATVSAPALTEPLLVAGGQVITISLTDDTWVAAGSAFDQVRQIILNGMVSAQTEDKGWNREILGKQPVTAVVRTSDAVVTITLVASPDYDITVGEVITDTVPDEALNASITPLIATPTIGVTADAPILQAHVVNFSSVSRLVKFSSTQRRVTFSSASRTIKIVDTPNPLGFILTEDDGIILQEDDLPIALE